MLTVRAPATSANLGPGFDSLSLALDLWNVVRLEPSPKTEVLVEGEGQKELPTDASNEVYRALYRVFEDRGERPPTVRLRCQNAIPLTRGLGSSSAARASGLLLGSQLLEERLSSDELINLGAELEGHPDNITACLQGGVQVSVGTEQGVRHCAVPAPTSVACVLYVPNFAMDTGSARVLLPPDIRLEAAVHNIGRAALLVAALASGRLELLRTATEDALHQEPRAAMFPAMPRFLEAALEAGAYGAFLSGAGSSILALSGDERLPLVRTAFEDTARAAGVSGRVLITGIAANGAHVADE